MHVAELLAAPSMKSWSNGEELDIAVTITVGLVVASSEVAGVTLDGLEFSRTVEPSPSRWYAALMNIVWHADVHWSLWRTISSFELGVGLSSWHWSHLCF